MNLTQTKTSQLNRITAAYALVFNEDYNGLRGFDTENKGVVSLIAKELLMLEDGVISSYYRLGVEQMKSQWQDVKIRMELDDVFMVNYHTVKRLWKAIVVDGEIIE